MKILIPGFFLFIALVCCVNSMAQNPIDGPAQACRNQDVLFSTSITGYDSIEWDFCDDDLLDISGNGITLTGIPGAAGIDGIEIIEHSGRFFGFILAANSNDLVRLEFGTSLTNTPIITNLGDLGILSRPTKIKLFRENGNWFAFSLNASSGNDLLILEFGNDPVNIPTVRNLGNFSGQITTPFGADLVLTDHPILFIADRSSRRLLKLDFNNGIANPPVLDVKQLPVTNFFRNVAFEYFNGTYIGLAVYENGEIYQLETTMLPGSEIQVKQINQALPPMNTPYSVEFFPQGDKLVSLVLSRTGELHQLIYSSDTDVIPAYNYIGNFGTFTLAFDFGWIKSDSRYHAFLSNPGNNSLYRLDINNTCDASVFTSDAANPPAIQYSGAGVKLISLTETRGVGKWIYFDSLLVNRGPDPQFSVSGQCIGSASQFINETILDVTPGTAFWDFGDGTTSTDLNPSHTFSSSGTFNVTLTMTDGCGESQSLVREVNIFPADDLQAGFSADAVVCTNTSNLFTDESTFTNDMPREWAWFSNGVLVSQDQNPQLGFVNSGSYNIRLEVTGVSGCISSVTRSIDVIDGPAPSFSVSDACIEAGIQFNNTSQGAITSYIWDFGDGTTSTAENPLYTYDQPGDYTVRLTTFNSAGCVSFIDQIVSVYAEPLPEFSTELACAGNPIQFIDESTVQNANIEGWLWDFGNGNTSTDQSPQFQFDDSGTFLVNLTVTSTFGCEATITKSVNVLPSPDAAFSFSTSCVNETVFFTDESIPAAGTSITSWAWDIGGEFSSRRNPDYVFDFPSDYEVTLIVTGSNQCIGTVTQTVRVPQPPNVAFQVDNPCVGDAVTFTDISQSPQDPLVSYQWDFAGLGVASGNVASFEFPGIGTYSVTLTVETQSGCSYSTQQLISIGNPPAASFTASTIAGAPPLSVNFTNTTANAERFEWYVNGELIAQTANFQFTFSEFGTYDVMLLAYNSSDCAGVATQMIDVVEPFMDMVAGKLVAIRNNNRIQLQMNVRNNGSINVQSFPVQLKLDDQVSINGIVNAPIAPGSEIVVLLPFDLEDKNFGYMCVEIADEIGGFPDSDLSNNSSCVTFGTTVQTSVPYPNPAGDELHVQIYSGEASEVRMEIINSLGQLVNTPAAQTERSGITTVTLNTSALRQGVYFLMINDGQAVHMHRIVISR
ncbi:T9SS type A sorting domain-containing protein [Fulvivirga sedimenti]|uniref:PKD domain-containing protein n=1 Tax=Fulvivirga sedimenti TaxID=2879465 RepID=A0A9X1L0T0_9BACT|nr:PKD domain-containing protein [Fulvivirga sedimenti]MCA6078109.1 PKD domain-containing protein [Fulvivirga sedimenti]